ncbi:MAG: ABC transporter substrate-binding protein [Nitrospirota bacterium]|nr:ABC transporter substrate-binding protein [Nitrospirota bacterium]MDE3224881.1 ABC transporter substrate-binding protein [Nitrospirota bacterium]MDE3241869.1 ABC transporter substrate-binding protein [Nitrospirota bacterium]
MMLWPVQESSLFAAGSPTARVRTTIDEVIRILSDEEMKKPARHQERRKLLETVIWGCFDDREMGRRALAAQWAKLSEAEREEYVHLFRSFLTDAYADKIEGYAGEQVQYLGERLEGSYAEVRTKLLSEKTTYPMEYRLLEKSGDWVVYDIIVDGISLVRNYRGQFERIIHTESYAALLEKLRKKSKDITSPKTKDSGSEPEGPSHGHP